MSNAAAYPDLLIVPRGPVTVLSVNRPDRLNALSRDTLGRSGGRCAPSRRTPRRAPWS